MNLEFDVRAKEDLLYWKKYAPKKCEKILALLEAITQDPFSGIGKPEPLKHQLNGCWSRRIDRELRLVYKVLKNTIIVLSCRYHYGD